VVTVVMAVTLLARILVLVVLVVRRGEQMDSMGCSVILMFMFPLLAVRF
jgi:hypothetical protein